MQRPPERRRRRFTTRGVLAVFCVQLLFLVVSMLRDVPLSFGGGVLDRAVFLVVAEAQLINAGIDFLLFSPSYVGDLDLLIGFLALPVVYYLTAVVVAVPGRAAYRFGKARLAR